MKKVLLIYENVPESTDVYLLDVADSDFEWMRRCHQNYINVVDNSAEECCDKLRAYLDDKMKFELIPENPTPIKDFDFLIITGFLL